MTNTASKPNLEYSANDTDPLFNHANLETSDPKYNEVADVIPDEGRKWGVYSYHMGEAIQKDSRLRSCKAVRSLSLDSISKINQYPRRQTSTNITNRYKTTEVSDLLPSNLQVERSKGQRSDIEQLKSFSFRKGEHTRPSTEQHDGVQILASVQSATGVYDDVIVKQVVSKLDHLHTPKSAMKPVTDRAKMLSTTVSLPSTASINVRKSCIRPMKAKQIAPTSDTPKSKMTGNITQPTIARQALRSITPTSGEVREQYSCGDIAPFTYEMIDSTARLQCNQLRKNRSYGDIESSTSHPIDIKYFRTMKANNSPHSSEETERYESAPFTSEMTDCMASLQCNQLRKQRSYGDLESSTSHPIDIKYFRMMKANSSPHPSEETERYESEPVTSEMTDCTASLQCNQLGNNRSYGDIESSTSHPIDIKYFRTMKANNSPHPSEETERYESAPFTSEKTDCTASLQYNQLRKQRSYGDLESSISHPIDIKYFRTMKANNSTHPSKTESYKSNSQITSSQDSPNSRCIQYKKKCFTETIAPASVSIDCKNSGGPTLFANVQSAPRVSPRPSRTYQHSNNASPVHMMASSRSTPVATKSTTMLGSPASGLTMRPRPRPSALVCRSTTQVVQKNCKESVMKTSSKISRHATDSGVYTSSRSEHGGVHTKDEDLVWTQSEPNDNYRALSAVSSSGDAAQSSSSAMRSHQDNATDSRSLWYTTTSGRGSLQTAPALRSCMSAGEYGVNSSQTTTGQTGPRFHIQPRPRPRTQLSDSRNGTPAADVCTNMSQAEVSAEGRVSHNFKCSSSAPVGTTALQPLKGVRNSSAIVASPLNPKKASLPRNTYFKGRRSSEQKLQLSDSSTAAAKENALRSTSMGGFPGKRVENKDKNKPIFFANEQTDGCDPFCQKKDNIPKFPLLVPEPNQRPRIT
ncbi:hypothetical protein SARC_02220 [Sphaeroforma arctica JP610]|uniref:Uncharacterized protein n=1 Tax=Sphaeroforma arctica JP610 TaxID=667725 RepID=A0A0L0G9M2_9EUKA|nr:hypothetical protein SARC_02220 [Sphaeroforma arctica JP610]KNC85599.1 hypothetical protein SARC_02220 [Sphaeroforma arctica JP610]|eukprot:XP_014159501.1 hypothetical protein SARC_02220 [Sphaeroforma arctica JP610]